MSLLIFADISGCAELSHHTVDHIHQMAPHLRSLFLGKRVDLYLKDERIIQKCNERSSLLQPMGN